MCEFRDCNSNGFRDILWTDKLIYLRYINLCCCQGGLHGDEADNGGHGSCDGDDETL